MDDESVQTGGALHTVTAHEVNIYLSGVRRLLEFSDVVLAPTTYFTPTGTEIEVNFDSDAASAASMDKLANLVNQRAQFLRTKGTVNAFGMTELSEEDMNAHAFLAIEPHEIMGAMIENLHNDLNATRNKSFFSQFVDKHLNIPEEQGEVFVEIVQEDGNMFWRVNGETDKKHPINNTARMFIKTVHDKLGTNGTCLTTNTGAGCDEALQYLKNPTPVWSQDFLKILKNQEIWKEENKMNKNNIHPHFMRNLLHALNFRVVENADDRWGTIVQPQSVDEWQSKLKVNIRSRLDPPTTDNVDTVVKAINDNQELITFLESVVGHFQQNPHLLNKHVATGHKPSKPYNYNRIIKGLRRKTVVPGSQNPFGYLQKQNVNKILLGATPGPGFDNLALYQQFPVIIGTPDPHSLVGGGENDKLANNPQRKHITKFQHSRGSGLLKGMYDKALKRLELNNQTLADSDQTKMGRMWDSLRKQEEMMVSLIVYLDKFEKLRQTHPTLAVTKADGSNLAIDDIIAHVNRHIKKVSQKYETKQVNFVNVLESIVDMRNMMEKHFPESDKNIKFIEPASF